VFHRFLTLSRFAPIGTLSPHLRCVARPTILTEEITLQGKLGNHQNRGVEKYVTKTKKQAWEEEKIPTIWKSRRSNDWQQKKLFIAYTDDMLINQIKRDSVKIGRVALTRGSELVCATGFASAVLRLMPRGSVENNQNFTMWSRHDGILTSNCTGKASGTLAAKIREVNKKGWFILLLPGLRPIDSRIDATQRIAVNQQK